MLNIREGQRGDKKNRVAHNAHSIDISSGDRNRTCDTGLMSPLLYRLSYATLSTCLGTGFTILSSRVPCGTKL